MSIKFMVDTRERLEELEAEVAALRKQVLDLINEHEAEKALPPAKKRDTLTLNRGDANGQ
jgi:hypothetical protein